MGVKKRQRWEVDILDTENGRTYTYSTNPTETPEKAMKLAMKEHGEDRVKWVGNVRPLRSL
jgi:hypothetical protein